MNDNGEPEPSNASRSSFELTDIGNEPKESPREVSGIDDSERKIDFVLVYRDKDEKQKIREQYELNLVYRGLKLERVNSLKVCVSDDV